MKRKTFRKICGTVCVAGLMVMPGTAGASDAGQISMKQIIVWSLTGLAMFAGGGYLGGFIE